MIHNGNGALSVGPESSSDRLFFLACRGLSTDAEASATSCRQMLTDAELDFVFG